MMTASGGRSSLYCHAANVQGRRCGEPFVSPSRGGGSRSDELLKVAAVVLCLPVASPLRLRQRRREWVELVCV